jgi:hypothetical protein
LFVLSVPTTVADQQVVIQLDPFQLAPGKPSLLTMVAAWSHSKYQPWASGVPKPLFLPGKELRNPSLQKKVVPPDMPESTMVTGFAIQWPALQTRKAIVTTRFGGLSF